MSYDDEDDAWGQLVCLTNNDSPPVSTDARWLISVSASDICFSANKLVSGCHCYIQKDDDGKVWLYDSSTNGTLYNMSEKMTKGECRELKHGDEFYIVFKKDDTELNIGYVYQNLEELKNEEELENNQTQEYIVEPTMVATLEDDNINEAEINDVDTETHRHENQKRKLDSPVAEESHEKVRKLDSESSQKPCVKNNHENDRCTASSDKDLETGNSGEKTSSADNVTTDNSEYDQKTDVDSVTKSKTEKKSGDDAIADSLICVICQEIFHDCVSLQPCMHSFCAGCYSEWKTKCNLCPSCRGKVDRINRNHMVNNLIDAYLKENPDKKRPEEDIKELDAKNTITRDMLYPARPANASDSEEDSPDYSDEEDHDDADDFSGATAAPQWIGRLPPPLPAPAPAFGQLFGLGNPVFGGIPARTICRQCKDYKEPVDLRTATAPAPVDSKAAGASGDEKACTSGENEPSTSSGDGAGTSADVAGPSTSGATNSKAGILPDEKVMPDPPKFQCPQNQNHVLCVCCLQPMPDRRAERFNNPDIPAQACTVCYRAYCHSYWGCRKADCSGCLSKFKDFNFGRKCLVTLILDNTHESGILKDYLDINNISVKDMLQECMTKLDNKTFSCSDQARFAITSETALCYPCGLRNFKDLAYLYRKGIPNDHLPAHVTGRADCYWGKHCRTQRNKPHHAINFNHICDQLRTMR